MKKILRHVSILCLTLSASFLFNVNDLNGQASLAPGGTLTQNFNTITTGATALPTGWKSSTDNLPNGDRVIQTSYTSAGTTMGNTMSLSSCSGIAGGGYALRNTTASGTGGSDYCVGYVGSSSVENGNLYLGITNSGASDIASFTISYSVEKYRNGNNASGYTVQMLYATSASAVTTGWTALGAGFNVAFASDGNTNCPNNTTPGNGANIPNATSTVVSQVFTPASPLAPGSTIYLVWNYAVTSGSTNTNAPQLGIDDVTIVANGGAGSNHTVSFTGSPSDFYTGEKFSAAANNTDYYITFDANYMYFGAFRTSGTFGTSDNFAIYIDTDPRSTTTSGNGTTGGRNYNSVTPTLPFNADFTSYTEQSYTDPINRYNGSWSSIGVTPTTNTSTTAREVRIALSDLGNPASVYVTMWMGYSGGIFSNAPGTNVGASATPTIAGFFGSFPVYKSGINPTSYRSQNTSSANGGGTAISDLTLTSSGNIADDYGDITISNAAVGTVSVANASFTGTLTLNNTSTVALGTNLLAVGGRGVGGTAGQVTMNNTSTTSVDGSTTAGTMRFLGLGLINGSNSARTFGTNSTVTLNGGVDFTSSATNVNGNLQINAGGYVNTNAPTYGSASTLIYNSGSTYTAGTEWTTNATTGAGVPFNVTIGNGVNTTLTFGSSTQYRAALGAVTIAASSGLTLSSGSGGDLYVGGNFTNSGTFTHASRAVFLNGTGTQTLAGTLNGSGTTNFFPYLFITNTAGNATCGVNINVGTSGQSSFTVATGGGLYIQTAGTFTLVSGALGTVNGTFRNSGATITNTGTMTVSGTGTYNHNMNGGTIGACTWSSGSNCLVTGTTTTEPAGLGQSFSDFSWNCTQSAARNLGGALTSVGRDLNIIGTNSQNLGLVASTGSLTLAIGRDLNISGGLLIGTTGTVTPTINIAGNLNISGNGAFTVVNSASTGAGTAAVNVAGNTSITSSSGTALVVNVSSSKSATLTTTGTFLLNGSGQVHMSQSTNATPNGTLTVNGATTLTAGTLNVANTSANSVGIFNVNAALNVNGATLNISTLGNGTVNLTDNLVLSSGSINRTSGTSTFNFNKASGTQTINQTSGTMSGNFAMNVGTGSTTNTVQLLSDLNIGGGTVTLTARNGSTLDFQNYTVTGSGACATVAGGGFKSASQYGFTTSTSGATGGSVQTTTRTYHAAGNYTFNGSGTQGTGNFFGSTTPTANTCGNLTIDNTSGVTLDANVAVQAATTLTNGHLTLGNNDVLTATISGAGSTKHFKTTGTGQLKQLVGTLFTNVLFPVGNTAYNPITLNNSGGLSDTYGIRVIDAVTSPAANDDTKLINRYWAVTEATAGTSTLTAAAQYNGGEENANFAAGTVLKMGLHNGTTWTTVAATSSGSGPYVVTNSSTFSPAVTTYTLGVGKDDGFAAPNVSYTWTGATDDSWATTTNWTPNGTPSLADDVLIDPANYTNVLIMTDSRQVTNFTVQNNGTYTMNSGSTLTVTGSFTYSSATSPTLDCASTLNVAGSTSQNIPAFNYGNLNLSGGARVLANSGTIGICGTYTPGSSTTVTGSTVNYNGTGAQTIAASNYNNLTISQNRSAATITLGTGTIDVAGTFDPSSASNYTVAVGTNTFNFNSSSSQSIPAFFYYSITNTGNGNRTWANSGVIDINNTFTPGTGTHTITGSTVRYSSTAASTFSLTTFTTNVASRQYNNLEIGGGASTIWQQTAAFNLGVANNFVYSGSGSYRIASGASTTAMLVDGTFTQSGSGTFRISGSATNAVTGSLTVTGNSTLNAGIMEVVGTSATTAHGAFTTNDLTIAGTGQLVLEVTAGTTGVATVTVNGDFVVTSTTANAVNIGAGTGIGNNQIALKGDFSKSGTGTLGVTGSTTSTAGYTFSGVGTQTFSHSGAAMSSGNFTVANGSSVQLLTNMTLGSSSASALNVAGTLDAGNFQVIAGASTSQFTLNATGTLIMNSATGVAGTISGFTIFPAFTSGGTFEFTGTNVNTGFATFTNISSTYTMTWTGSGSLTLDKNIDLTNFNFTNTGLVHLRNFNMTISATGAITGGSFGSGKMIVTDGTGILIRNITSGGVGIPFTWPIGEVTGSTEYSPVTINNISTSIAGTIGFNVTDGVHSSMGAATSYLSRYWEYSVTGLGTYNWTNATFTYTSGDIVVGPETSLKVNTYNSGTAAWTEFATSSAASNVLTFTSGATNSSVSSGDEITGRIDVPVYYQTVGTGPASWATPATWEASLSPLFTSPFTPAVPPSYANSALIRINAGHTVTVTSSTTADDLVINGTVDASGGSTVFTVNNGTSATDATIASTGTLQASTNNTTLAFSAGALTSVDGTVRIIGTTNASGASISNATGSTINFNSGSTYEHARDGGTLSMGGTVNYNSGSTCKVTGLTLNIPAATSFGQTFHNLVFDSPSQTATLNLSGNLTTVNGSLKMLSTGSGIIRLASTQGFTLNIADSLIVAGTAALQVASTSGTQTINVTGPYYQTGGIFSRSNAGTSNLNFDGDFTQLGGTFETGTAGSPTVTVSIKGNIVHNGAISRSSGTGAFNLNKGAGGTQTWSQTGGTYSGAVTWNIGNASTNTVQMLSNVSFGSSAHTIAVQNGAKLDMGPYVLSGTNTGFTVNATGGVKMGHASGIVTAPTADGNVQTLTRTFPGTASYFYNGTVNQVTGNALPGTLTTTGNLNIANTGTSGNNTVTLTNNNTTTPTFNLQAGLFAANTLQQLNITSGGTVNGTGGDFATGATAGLINFPGSGTWTGNSNPYNVHASGGVNFGSGTVTIQNGGRFRINAGGFVNTNAPYYGSGSLLQYFTGSTYGRNLEWSASSGRGYPHHVQVSNNTTVDGANGGSSAALLLNTAGDLTVDSGSSLYLDFGGNNVTQDLVVAGSLNLTGNLSWSQASGADMFLAGNFTNNGASSNLFTNNRALFLNGTGTQTFSGSYPLTFIFPYLIVNKTSGSVVLARDIQVSTTLTFSATNTAIIDASTFTVYVSNNSTSAVDRQGLGHVNGNLRRAFATGTNTYLMTVGDVSVYAPINIAANGVSVAGSMTSSSTSGDHSQIASSGLESTKSVNRTWNISQTGLTLTNYNPTFNFVAGDLDGGANTSNFIVGRYSSGWSYPSVGTLTSTSTQATGLTAYGEFAVAECKTPNAYTVTGGGSYCSGGSGIAVGLSGSDDWVSYQLQRNGVDVGSPVIGTGAAISFGNQTSDSTYTVVGTNISSPSCTASMTGSVFITIIPSVPASVTIGVSPASTICSGTSVTFTAIPQFGGVTPSYQWQVNGSNVGTDSPTYNTSGLTNGQQVQVLMTSSEVCPSPTIAPSNIIVMTVLANGTPTVSIAASPSSTICSGDEITFTATPTFGGSNPSYQWKLNGSDVGTDSDTYLNAALVNGDQVSCVMTSDYACALAPTATSNTITMTVTAAPQVDAGSAMTTCGTSAYLFANGATSSNVTGVSWTENGAGSITSGGTTLTPTYTPAAGDLGNTVTFTLTGTANSPCVNATDVVTLYVAALQLWYLDSDGDGFGNPLGGTVASCTQPVGRVLDNTDCCDSNADINPSCEWWADVDGDGYGSFVYVTGCVSGCSGFASTIPWYPPAHGGALYSMDCDDNNVNVHPTAPEICQNSIDDDCDLTIDEGCSGIINDTWSNAITLNVANPNMWYPNCNVQNGTLVNADVSIEANPSNVDVGGGRDIWYRFQANSTGVQIKVVPSGFDAVIELRTAAHPSGQVDVETVNNSVGGAEILNTNSLTVGQIYFVGIRNKNATNTGTFTLCVSPLMPSSCATVEPAGGIPLCSNFKAIYRAAASYTFNFTGTGGAAAFPFVTTSGTSTSGLIPMSTPSLDIRYGGEYSARVDANYQLYNGLNAAEPVITIPGSNTPTGNCLDIDIIATPQMEVKLSQRCPAVLIRNSYLIATPVISGNNACGAISYTYRFTQVDACSGIAVGIPFTVNTTSNTPYMSLNVAFPGPLYPQPNLGYWKVEVRPNFSYGSGSFGPSQYIQINNTAASGMSPDHNDWIEGSKATGEQTEALIYPNPTDGSELRLVVTHVTGSLVFVRILDSSGRVVVNEQYTSADMLNTTIHFTGDLPSGVYFVELKTEDWSETKSLMIIR